MADLTEFDVAAKRRYRAELGRTEQFAPAQMARYTQERLLRLLDHAQRNVPYWRKRLAPVLAGGRFDPKAWRALAPLTRPVIVAKLEELSARSVPASAGATHIGQTSGSTGAPMRYRASASDNIANAALTERSFDWWGLEGARDYAQILYLPAVWPTLVEGGLRGWRPGEARDRLPGRSLALQIDTPVDQQLDWLLRWRPDYLNTRSTNLEALAEASLRRGLDLRFRLVMSISGPVSQDARDLGRQAFGAEIYDTYGTSECGHLAAECPVCRVLHVNSEARLIEVVREDMSPCQPGEVGRVLVTSYTNYAMPLIRYDLGDYAEQGPVHNPCGRVLPSLARVLGRETETFMRRDGTRFFPAVVARSLQQVMPLKQVQFAQTQFDLVEIRYVPADGDPPVDVEAVQRYVARELGEEWKAQLVPVAAIARPPGGKYFYHRCELQRHSVTAT